MSSTTEEELARQRTRNQEVGRAGERWLEAKRAEIEALPTGTVVIFNIETGEYVTGSDGITASAAFHSLFGESTPGFIHRVRHPIFVGGGLFGGTRG